MELSLNCLKLCLSHPEVINNLCQAKIGDGLSLFDTPTANRVAGWAFELSLVIKTVSEKLVLCFGKGGVAAVGFMSTDLRRAARRAGQGRAAAEGRSRGW